VGNYPALYTDHTRALIASHMFNNRCETAIHRPALGDSAGVLGAALLVG